MTYSATLRDYLFGDTGDWGWASGGGAEFQADEYRADRQPYIGADGVATAGGDYMSTQLVSWNLIHSSGSQTTVESASEDLRAAFAPCRSGLLELTLVTPYATQVLRGRPRAPMIVPSENDFGVGRARVVFEMTDPLRYNAASTSVTVSFSGMTGGVTSPVTSPVTSTGGGSTGDASVSNAGTANAPWTATITGGTVDTVTPRLILGGQTIQINGTIPPGSQCVVTSQDGQVTLDGQPRPWVAFTSVWWDIPPGQSTFSARASSGDGTATLTWRDASY